MNLIDRTGERHVTNEGYEIEIVNYRSSLDCDIMFLDNKHLIFNINYYQIKNKQVKNPFHKSVYGVGFIGEGTHVAHNKRKPTVAYDTWIGMLRRCYSKKSFEKRPTYKNVTVCEEWLNFQNFASWFEKNYVEGFYLDKDILSGENKIYSPETCCFVTNSENNSAKNKDKRKMIKIKLSQKRKDNIEDEQITEQDA